MYDDLDPLQQTVPPTALTPDTDDCALVPPQPLPPQPQTETPVPTPIPDRQPYVSDTDEYVYRVEPDEQIVAAADQQAEGVRIDAERDAAGVAVVHKKKGPKKKQRRVDNTTSSLYFSKSETLKPLVPPPQPKPPAGKDGDHCSEPQHKPQQTPKPTAAAVIDKTPKFPELPIRTDITQEILGNDFDTRGSTLGTADQLAAVGPQNYLLDLNPQTTLFKKGFQRHTAFASECYDDDYILKFGQMTVMELFKRGDILGDVFLDITLPNLGIPGGQWSDAIGYVLMNRVRLIIDDVVIHDQEKLWYDISDKLCMPHGRLQGINEMIGRGRVLATDAQHHVLLPFKFLCCKNHYRNQQFLPLRALSTSAKITVEFTTETLAGCLVLPPGVSVPRTPTTGLQAKLMSEQMFVEQDEQRALMQRPISLMVETAQDVEALSYKFDDSGSFDIANVSLDLRELNLPVKMLAWVAYDDSATAKGQYFKYLDCTADATLFVNSNERFTTRAGRYFDLVQTYQHCTRSSSDLVHMYSFARDTCERQPTGALNFAVLDRPTLRVRTQNIAGRAVKFKLFAQCINWLQIDAGSLAMKFT